MCENDEKSLPFLKMQEKGIISFMYLLKTGCYERYIFHYTFFDTINLSNRMLMQIFSVLEGSTLRNLNVVSARVSSMNVCIH